MSVFYTTVFTWGNRIFFKGYKDGERYTEEIPNYKPEFFYETEQESDYKTIYGRNLKRVSYKNIKTGKEALKENREVMRVYGNSDIAVQFIQKNFPLGVKYDLSLVRIGYLDIETECEYGFPDIEYPDERINVITIRINGENYVWALGEVTVPARYLRCFTDEKEMLQDFLDSFPALDLDVLSGYNIAAFDIPYIINRMKQLDLDFLALSEYRIIKEREMKMMGRAVNTYEIMGVNILDYFVIIYDMKYHPKRFESYTLQNVATEILKRGKVDYSNYASIKEFYKNDFQKFVEYNIQDVVLVEEIEKKKKLLQVVLAIGYDAKITFNSVFYATKIWESICYAHLYSQNIICEIKNIGFKSEKFKGAFVQEPVPGMYHNIVSFDATSLYPSIIRSYNISPETIYKGKVTDETKHLYTHCANNTFYTKEKIGFIPYLIGKTFEERQVAKKQMLELERSKEAEGDADGSKEMRISALDVVQQVKKVLANSLYGCLGTPNFMFYEPALPTAVTTTAQKILHTAHDSVNKTLAAALNLEEPKEFVIAADTDSVYVNLDDIVKKENPQDVVQFLDDYAKNVVQKGIQDALQEYGKETNVVENYLYFKRETIATTGIFAAKKRYALVVMDKENVRYKKPEILIKGFETQRTTTPKFIREALKKAIEIILLEDNSVLIDFVKKFEQEFYTKSLKDIAQPKGCNNLEKYSDRNTIYSKGTPGHVRAALLYNWELKQRKLESKYPTIKEGEKIKILALKIPNPFGIGKQKWLAFVGEPPTEFGVEEYVDYKSQYQKTFHDPITSITDAIGWHTKVKPSIRSLFI